MRLAYTKGDRVVASRPIALAYARRTIPVTTPGVVVRVASPLLVVRFESQGKLLAYVSASEIRPA